MSDYDIMAFVSTFVLTYSFVTSSQTVNASHIHLQPPRYRPWLQHHVRLQRPSSSRCGLRMNATPSNNSAQSDQWEQLENRDPSMDEQQTIVNAISNRQRHTHIFLQKFATKTFSAAADRFMKTLQSYTNPAHRLWLLRTVADPTFGSLRGQPHPPRCVIITIEQDPNLSSTVLGWISSLDRAGRALSPVDSHFVDWAICAQHITAPHSEPPMRTDYFVAFEILNADWSDANTIPAMRELLDSHARDVVEAGYASSFEVLQSIESPACFKTLEVYPSIQHLQDSLKHFDEPFATEMLEHRAAVNRVRQLHQCMSCLPLEPFA